MIDCEASVYVSTTVSSNWVGAFAGYVQSFRAESCVYDAQKHRAGRRSVSYTIPRRMTSRISKRHNRNNKRRQKEIPWDLLCSAGPNNKKCRRSRLLWTMRKDSGFEMMKRNSEFQENNLYLSSSYGKIESVSVGKSVFQAGMRGTKIRMCKQRKAIFSPPAWFCMKRFSAETRLRHCKDNNQTERLYGGFVFGSFFFFNVLGAVWRFYKISLIFVGIIILLKFKIPLSGAIGIGAVLTVVLYGIPIWDACWLLENPWSVNRLLWLFLTAISLPFCSAWWNCAAIWIWRSVPFRGCSTAGGSMRLSAPGFYRVIAIPRRYFYCGFHGRYRLRGLYQQRG